MVVGGEVDAREEGFDGRVTVDDGGDEDGAVFEESAEREEEEREKYECWEERGECYCGATEDSGGCTVIPPRR